MSETLSETDGYWWNPETPEELWAGSLSFDPAEGAHLSMALKDRPPPPRTLSHYPVIHGHAVNGRAISLLGCFDRSSRYSSTGIEERHIFANRVIDGFLAESDDPSIASAEVLFQGLHAWIMRSGFAQSLRPPFNLDLSYTQPPRVKL